ncbi:MAG: pilus assembly protein N-terminal domain-containing protein [Planctomycetales bacterium]|nr:pilus assembly protein N-terminal domain-containing protein [Planctomycetales bacterium]
MAVSNKRAQKGSTIKKRILGWLLSTGAAILSCQSVHAQQLSDHIPNGTTVSVDTTRGHQSIQMVVNDSRELVADRPFEQIRIHNQNVLKALPLGGDRLQISALTTGITNIDLIVGNSTHTIEVLVLADARMAEAVLREAFPTSNLRVTPFQQACIVSGTVANASEVELIVSICEQFFGNVINNVDVTGVQTIQLETQIMEVSRTKLRELGVDWAFGNNDDFIGQSVSGLLVQNGANFASNATAKTLEWGVVQNGTQFLNTIRALRSKNLVKVLANPTLIAVDGRPASFNSGGEIPIVVPAGLGQVGVQYREFGTRVDFMAKVQGEGKIYLEVRPYISEIDPSRSVTIQGVSVPGLRSRFLETGVTINAGETLALAGLLQVRTETLNKGLPGLSDLPYLGALFRTTRDEQNEVELLITVTPHFAGALTPDQIPQGAPGLFTQPPTDKELYLKSYMETPVVDDGGLMGVPNEGFVPQFTPSANYAPAFELSPSVPAPNPAAMSVGPNVPRIAQQPAGANPEYVPNPPGQNSPAIVR